MIKIEIPNMTARQRRMLTSLWNMTTPEEVYEWIYSQPTLEMQQEAETMQELIVLAVIDQEMRTNQAKKELDRIFGK